MDRSKEIYLCFFSHRIGPDIHDKCSVPGGRADERPEELRRGEEIRHLVLLSIPGPGAAIRTTVVFFECFPLFVPSLSW